MKANPSAVVDDVLTREECAAWLKVRPRELDRLGVPSLKFSHKIRRYLRADVAKWLDGRRKAKP